MAAKARSETILQGFGDYYLWKSHVNRIGFIPALNHHLQHVHKLEILREYFRKMLRAGTAAAAIPEKVHKGRS
ncbi:hypothetical protein ACOSP7_020212 [Xanthoceras sorbifolium]